MEIKMDDNYKLLRYEAGGQVAIVSTPKKKEDGLLTDNDRPFWKRLIFREPQIIKLEFQVQDKGVKA